ncbi:MAG: DinB family protein [Bacteroidota bacterium]|nr:DinB family protein [Bacteroidota bacterium]
MINKEIYKDAPEYCYYFFDLVQTNNLLSELEKSKELTLNIFNLITSELENYSYETNKWTIKEVLRHIIDMERIFQYRAFRFSRFDNTELSSVEENDYIKNVKQNEIKLSDLKEDYLAVRNSTINLYKNMTEKMLDFKGTANGQAFTSRTLGFAMVGHNLHHINFVKTKYFK